MWESDDSLRVQIAFDSVHPSCLSFTLTDSFFNYRRTNLHGAAIPPRAYHNELFTVDELPRQLDANDLPTEAWRTDSSRQFEVYVEAPLDTCEKRDPKQLYKKARAGEISDFTGLDAPYEPPANAEVVLKTHEMSAAACAGVLEKYLREHDLLQGPK